MRRDSARTSTLTRAVRAPSARAHSRLRTGPGGKIRVYLDSDAIKPGRPWRNQFVDGLTHSLVFVPFVSRGTLLSMAGAAPRDRTRAELLSHEYAFDRRLAVDESGAPDNVLIEWQLAVSLHTSHDGKYALACQEVRRRGAPRNRGSRRVASPYDLACRCAARCAQIMPLLVGEKLMAYSDAADAHGTLSTLQPLRDQLIFRETLPVAVEGKHMKALSAWDEGKSIHFVRVADDRSAIKLTDERTGDAVTRAVVWASSPPPDADPATIKRVVERIGGEVTLERGRSFELPKLFKRDDTGFFWTVAPKSHAKIFAELFDANDREDCALVEEASRLSPATLVHRLFTAKHARGAEGLSVPIYAALDDVAALDDDSSKAPNEESCGDSADACKGDAKLEMARGETTLSERKRAEEMQARLEAANNDPLELLALQWADQIETVVQQRYRENLGLGLGSAMHLQGLRERFSYVELLGEHLTRCGRRQVVHLTAEELQMDGEALVLLVFGEASQQGTIRLARRIRSVCLRLGPTRRRVEVVYVSSDASEAEFDRFGMRDGSGWWAVPHRVSGTLGKRMRKHFKVSALPTVVVTQWDVAKRCVALLNEDATQMLADDPKGERYPWKEQTIDDMLGPVLVDKEKKRHDRVDALKHVQVLAIYFGGQWCPHCVTFKPTMDTAHKVLNEERTISTPRTFEIVYVSSDQSQSEFDDYFGKMAWCTPRRAEFCMLASSAACAHRRVCSLSRTAQTRFRIQARRARTRSTGTSRSAASRPWFCSSGRVPASRCCLAGATGARWSRSRRASSRRTSPSGILARSVSYSSHTT